MIGILIQLVLSWLILWLVSRKHLSVLGFYPTKKRLTDLGAGLLIAAACCATYNLVSAALAGNGWKINSNATVKAAFANAWWMFKSVLFEELIFRGALLYLAIQWLGKLKATFISAICFGVYHWFSYNLFGNPIQMTFVFIGTALAGLAFAYAFVITRSLYLPVALHFGWNYVNSVVFPNGPINDPMFNYLNSNKIQGVPSLMMYLFQVISLPWVVYLYLRLVKKRLSNVMPASKPVANKGEMINS